MEANPRIPTTENGRRRVVNAAFLPALTAPGQLAVSNQASSIILPKWRSALAKVNAGAANARILCFGDSTTFGVGSDGSLTIGNMKAQAWPTFLANMFTVSGVNTHTNSFMGSATGAGGSNANDTNDPRVVMGSGWSQASATFITVGGAMYTCSSATSALSFTPTVPVDTFVVFYYRNTSAGTFSYNLNGGSATTQSTSGSSGVASVTVTGTLGINALNLNYSSGNALYIIGVEAYDSSKKWLDVINAGVPAITTLLAATNNAAYSPVASGISGIAPNLTIISLGLNDLNTGKLLGTSRVNMQTIIAACVAAGSDVLLATFNPGQITGSFTAANQLAYNQMVYGLAAANNIPIVDSYNRMGSYNVNNANGLAFDSLHLTAAGYSDYASGIFNMIGNA